MKKIIILSLLFLYAANVCLADDTTKGRLLTIVVLAEDVEKTAGFYRDVVGLRQLPPAHDAHKHKKNPPRFGLKNVILIILEGKAELTGDIDRTIPQFAISIPDFDAAVQRLKDHGTELPWGIEGDESFQWIIFYDPAGNLVELTSERKSH